MSHADNTAQTPAAQTPPAEMTPQDAYVRAWLAYLSMLILPFVVFLFLISFLTFTEPIADRQIGRAWFVVTLIYIAVAVPLSFFIRSHFFRAYWKGSVVAPRDYLRGMLTVWVTIEIAGLLSLLGCFVSRSLAPEVIPALIAFVLFTPFWPSGQAMIRPVGAAHDTQVFSHPR